MIALRPYQLDAIERVRQAYRNGARAVVLQMPTGAGKTATAAEAIRASVSMGYRVVFAAHLSELIEDTSARLTAAEVPHGIVQSDRPANPGAPVQVCSLATLHRRELAPPADLVIVDECRHAMAASIRTVLDRYQGADLLGLDATPQRGDGQPLGDVWDALVCGPTVRELTQGGYLVPCQVVSPPTPEDKGIAMDPVDAWERWAGMERAIVFAASVEHAQELAKAFRAWGTGAECIVGETPRRAREGIRRRLEDGTTTVLTGVGVFLEGFDAPCVSCVILARPFSVTGALLQAIGRGLRPWQGWKERCTVLDLCGSVLLHGLPDEDRVWSLDGRAVRRTETMPALRRCPECLAVFRPAKTCPRCGAYIVSGSSTKVPRNLRRDERMSILEATTPQHTRDKRYLESCLWIARSRFGLHGASAEHRALEMFRKRFGREPTLEVR